MVYHYYNFGHGHFACTSNIYSILPQIKGIPCILFSVCSSVCPSVRPSVYPGLVGRTFSSRILQLGTFDQHDEIRMLIVFQGRGLKDKVVLSHSRKTLKTGYRINSKLQDHTTWYKRSSRWEKNAYGFSRSEVKGPSCIVTQ